MRLEIEQVDWEFASTFRISSRSLTHAETVQVRLIDGDHVGRGEAQGVYYLNETAATIIDQIEQCRDVIEAGVSRQTLRDCVLPPGGARNAIDCALWDLESKRTGRRAWENAGLGAVTPLRTAYTLSVASPAEMAEAASEARSYSLLKLKLAGAGDVERVSAVRQMRPDASIIVDANQAWSEQQLYDFLPEMDRLGVELIEQPLPLGEDDCLLSIVSPVPLCADESCQTRASVAGVLGKYEFVNIKLDKTGGLTEALDLANAACTEGLRLMVGCMSGSSLAMAPSFIVGQLCEYVDLDGPLLARSDIEHAIDYKDDLMGVPSRALWG